ncbi:hypothetical protein AAFC00_007236 [Neodothiora populina]|uniref:C3H1-type domain-containing protein n=1 Tax=Neodothiora populina TaxID=2781224 RepID=A0ABR3PHL5_9PEZI
MSGPKPEWFISRGAGVYTALIPADELPRSIQLKGVPRVMAVDEVVGMAFVAETRSARQCFSLDGGPSAARASPSLASTTASARLPHTSEEPSQRVVVGKGKAPEREDMSQESERSAIAIASASRTPTAVIPARSTLNPVTHPVDSFLVQRPLPPSGQEPDETKKVYCSYWIRHGDCDYMQQGCKYKHEMPGSLEEMKPLGFRRWPKWRGEDQVANGSRGRSGASREVRIEKRSRFFGPDASQARIAPIREGTALDASSKMVDYKGFNEPHPRIIEYGSTDLLHPRTEATTAIATAGPARQPATRSTSNTITSRVDHGRSSRGDEVALPKKRNGGLTLIDLSDAEEEESDKHLSAATRTAERGTSSKVKKRTSHLPSLSISSYSSDSEGTHGPHTPQKAATMAPSAASKVPGVFVPRGESSHMHQDRFRRYQQSRPAPSSARGSSSSSPGQMLVNGPAKPRNGTGDQMEKRAIVDESAGGVANPRTARGLNASIHASPALSD